MPSEAEVKYGYCPRCGAKSVDRERRLNGNDRCENGHQYPSAHATPTRPRFQQNAIVTEPQAEVVASSRPEVPPCIYHLHYRMVPPNGTGRWKLLETTDEADFREWLRVYSNGGWETYTVVYGNPQPPPAQGKESPCSNESQGGVETPPHTPSKSSSLLSSPESSSPSPSHAPSPNPPAWATPQILAACGPGERLLKDSNAIRAYPSRQVWRLSNGKKYEELTNSTEAACLSCGDELYTVPPTPPAAKCDGSGTIKWDTGGPAARCKGCPACKPEPKDGAEEVARRITMIYPFTEDEHRTLRGAIAAAIRADREKQAARPATELRGKILSLCHRVHETTASPEQLKLAREVLAQLEAP